MTDKHPNEGDTLVLTDIVYDRCVLGTGLPAGFKLANSDQTFDSFEVVVENISTHKVRGRISSETLTLRKPDGDTVRVCYRGREPIAGNSGGFITATNSQGATQGYTWEKAE